MFLSVRRSLRTNLEFDFTDKGTQARPLLRVSEAFARMPRDVLLC